MIHELKTDPIPFVDLASNYKKLEIRRDDRPYNVGDELLCKETKYSAEEMAVQFPLEFTGHYCRRIVTHCLRGTEYGVRDGFVAMSVRPLRKGEK